MEIALTYDRLGSRLRAIGDVTIEYDRLGSRPARLGDLPLTYGIFGARLEAVGDTAVTVTDSDRPESFIVKSIVSCFPSVTTASPVAATNPWRFAVT